MKRTPIVFSVGGLSLVVTALVLATYAVFTRAPVVLTGRPSHVLIATMVAATLVLLVVRANVTPRLVEGRHLVAGAVTAGIYVLALLGMQCVAEDLADLWALPSLQRPISGVLLGSAVLAIGGGLFFIRLRLRFLYGITEVVAGVVVALHKVSTEIADIGSVTAGWSLAFLTAAVYLVVRGLDNMHQGMTKEPLDAALLWIWRFAPGSSRRLAWKEYRHQRSKFCDARPWWRLSWLDLSERHPDRREFVVPARVFGKPALMLSQLAGAEQRLDYMQRTQRVRTNMHFLLLDDDYLVFRLGVDALKYRRMFPKDVDAWDPRRDGNIRDEWTAVSSRQSRLWDELAGAAHSLFLLDKPDAGAEEAGVQAEVQ